LRHFDLFIDSLVEGSKAETGIGKSGASAASTILFLFAFIRTTIRLRL
jgi:hypothetical protein